MARTLVSGSSNPGLSPGRARDIVLCSWSKLLSLTVPVVKLNPGDNPAMDLHPIQGRSRSTPSCFILQKPG